MIRTEVHVPKLKVLLTIYALFMALVGGAFLALPLGTLELYGVIELSLLEEVLARSLGALMIGYGTMSWAAARSRTEFGARDPLLMGVMVSTALWAIVCVWTGLSIGGNWFFWAEAAGFATVTVIFFHAWQREATVPDQTKDASPAVSSLLSEGRRGSDGAN